MLRPPVFCRCVCCPAPDQSSQLVAHLLQIMEAKAIKRGGPKDDEVGGAAFLPACAALLVGCMAGRLHHGLFISAGLTSSLPSTCLTPNTRLAPLPAATGAPD